MALILSLEEEDEVSANYVLLKTPWRDSVAERQLLSHLLSLSAQNSDLYLGLILCLRNCTPYLFTIQIYMVKVFREECPFEEYLAF